MEPMSVQVFEGQNASANASGGHVGTSLSPSEEVMPAGVINTSNARGNALFKITDNGNALEYHLNVTRIENVFQAHIHLAPAGSNGPIVVWLYPSTAASAGPLGQGRIQGVISRGTITADNLIGPLGSQPLSALIDAIAAGNTYVNVHTNDGVDPTNSGPGDYPGGELRGQIDHMGH